MAKEDDYSKAAQFTAGSEVPHDSPEVPLALYHLLPAPAEVKLLLVGQPLCGSTAVSTSSRVSPQLRPLLAPWGPALRPGADLLVTMMG